MTNCDGESPEFELTGSAPAGDDQLALLLIVLTVVAGIVDAVSYLQLGHVFVANLTGNVVFLGFAAAGTTGVDLVASIVALSAFLFGARIATLVIARAGNSRSRMLAHVTSVNVALILTGVALALAVPIGRDTPARYALAAVLAVAMGAQSAVAKKLAVPDLLTTVVTMTLTALGAGGAGGRRRIAAVNAMGGGALAGSLVVLHVNTASALLLAATLTGVVAAAAWRRSSAGASVTTQRG